MFDVTFWRWVASASLDWRRLQTSTLGTHLQTIINPALEHYMIALTMPSNTLVHSAWVRLSVQTGMCFDTLSTLCDTYYVLMTKKLYDIMTPGVL